MKQKAVSILLALALVMLTGCSSEPDGKINMPSSSKKYEGANYKEVVSELQGAGFTNVEAEALADMTTGLLSKEEEVDKVTVDGNTTFSTDSRYPADVKIVVSYHSFPESEKPVESEAPVETTGAPEEAALTVTSSDDLAALLAGGDGLAALCDKFASGHHGQTIEFDGCITFVANHGDYDTRYDLLLSAGDYVDENTANPGPVFKFNDVNTTDMGIKDMYLPDFISAGSNVKITAKVVEYDAGAEVMILDPVGVVAR